MRLSEKINGSISSLYDNNFKRILNESITSKDFGNITYDNFIKLLSNDFLNKYRIATLEDGTGDFEIFKQDGSSIYGFIYNDTDSNVFELTINNKKLKFNSLEELANYLNNNLNESEELTENESNVSKEDIDRYYEILHKINEVHRQNRINVGSQSVLYDETMDDIEWNDETLKKVYGLTDEELDIFKKVEEDMEKSAEENSRKYELTEGTNQKRIARYREFDNGHVLHSWYEMSDDEAEEKAKQASINDPTDVYYVAYDDIMNPNSGVYWYKGKSYSNEEVNEIRRKEKENIEIKESESPDKYEILSRIFARYPDISEEDEDYLNSLSLDELIYELKSRGWNDVLDEE